MDSAMVHKMIKARQYAGEPERIQIHGFTAELDGDDRRHRVELREGVWSCDCEYFRGHDVCAHTMTFERLFGTMLPASA